MWQDLFSRADLIHAAVPKSLESLPGRVRYFSRPATLQHRHHSAGSRGGRSLRLLVGRAAVLVVGHQRHRRRAVSGFTGRCPSGSRPERSRGVLLAVRFLEHKRVIVPSSPALPETPAMRWLNRFDEHLERVAGAAASTRRQYHLIAARFLQQRFGGTEPEWPQVCADDLSSFAQSEATRRKGFGRKVPAVALRAFLRFLVAHGCIRDGLAAAIPSPRQYQHATLPDRATTEQVNAVLARCQDGTAVGLRDYAVLLLLVRLGIVRLFTIPSATVADFSSVRSNSHVHGNPAGIYLQHASCSNPARYAGADCRRSAADQRAVIRRRRALPLTPDHFARSRFRAPPHRATGRARPACRGPYVPPVRRPCRPPRRA
jgi:hypothetical protein